MADSGWGYDPLKGAAHSEGTLSGDVEIPESIDDHTIYALGSVTLYGQNEVTSLVMPDTMYSVQSSAISYMGSLKSVTLNDALEFIGDGNFDECPELTSLTIPAGVRVIDGSIRYCENLREIRFTGECPIFENVERCFYSLPDDYVIYVPDDQLDAYTEALQAADGAVDHLQASGEKAVIPEQENKEAWFTFDEATGAITDYIEHHAYVEIPESIGGVAVKSVAPEAMLDDTAIHVLVLPEGIEEVGDSAFGNATNLGYITFPSTLKTIGDEAFFHTNAARIYWSEGLEEIGARAFANTKGNTLTLPSTVKRIGDSAFEGCWLYDLYLSGDMESIGSRAFADTSISYMAFDFYEPIEIAEDAFAGTYVADLDLPWDSSVENREKYAEIFAEQCPECTVWINNPISAGVAECPENTEEITTIENGVWTMYNGDAADLTIWTYYDDIQVTALGDGLFKGNKTIRSFYPHHCGWFTTIGNETFADSSIEYVDLFEGIETIGNGAFRNCQNLTELILPASLTNIGADALDGCVNLQKLTVLCDPAILPDGLLEDCTALTEVYAAKDATDQQIASLSEMVGYPWYSPVSRVGETRWELIEMPYEELSMDDFWYDLEYTRLDRYHGYELNLYLPREAEGVMLNTIGGDMMGRAHGGDNYEMELPVRSVVIPENYTNLLALGFADCETLETVICYAPLEQVPDSLFSGCTNLREVVFVNGVRSVGTYVFSGCENLETVYLGGNVETISETALLNDDGSQAFDQSNCITDPALLPDVDALLAAVKSDPMPEPEPEPEPAEAAPVGEEGAAFVGKWQADTMELEGEVYSVADMGVEMTFTLYADGVAESFDGENTDVGVWTVEDGAAIVSEMPLVLTEDGKLVMDDPDMIITFIKIGEAEGSHESAGVAQDSGESVEDAEESFIGTWYGCYMATGVMDGDPRELFELILTVNEDGTANLAYPTDEPYHWTQQEDGSLLMVKDIDDVEMPLTMLNDGFICFGSMDGDGNSFGGYIIFNRDENAVWTPDMLKQDLEEAATEAEGDISVSAELSDRMEVRYVCQSAEAGGVTLNASMLGGEYALTFHANGTVDFVMVGNTIPGLKWTQGDGAFVIDYYGNSLEAVLTEEGLDMNYFDSMLMHFAPEN